MNYIGSKLKLSSWIEDEVKKVVSNDLSERVFCDMCRDLYSWTEF